MPGLAEIQSLVRKAVVDGETGALEAEWPVDDLIKLYLAETVPEYLSFEPAAVWLEIRGTRGEFGLARLGRGEFLFRQSIRGRDSIAAAAECALDADANFDSGAALASLIACGLVTGIAQAAQEERHG